jgi:hypothetical protein
MRNDRSALITPNPRPVRRRSLLGSVPVLVAMITAVAHLVATADTGGVLASPRQAFFFAWLTGVMVFALVAASSRSATRRSLSGTVATVGMLIAGAAGVMTIGLPLGVAGVLEGLLVMTSVEAAAENSRWVWPALILVALVTGAAFAVGISTVRGA